VGRDVVITAGGDLAPLFAPRRIAIVGASHTPGKIGSSMAESLKSFDQGERRIALVNHRGAGFYPSLFDAAEEGPIDLVIMCVPASACLDLVEEVAAVGASAAMICSGGFAEIGGLGPGLQDDLITRASEKGIRLLGPNTSGFIDPRRKLIASFVPGIAAIPSGRVAIVAASGGVNHALAFLFAEAGHGLSLAVGLGNAADVTASDVLDYLATDPETAAVALHLESVDDGPRLVDAITRLVPHTPVVALVVGRNDVADFAVSHTGNLATSWRTTRAALSQAGAVLVDDERELVDAVGALSVTRSRPRAGASVGVVTAQAGPGLLLLDDLRGRGIEVPELSETTQETLSGLLPPLTFQRNPVDTGRPSPEFGKVLAAVAADPASDVVAAYALYEPKAVDLAAAGIAGRLDGVPLVVGVGGTAAAAGETRAALLEAGIATAADSCGVAAAAAALLTDAQAQHRRVSAEVRKDRLMPCCDAESFDEAQAKDVVDQLGISTMPRRVCGDRLEAQAALKELGPPVAVKLLDAEIFHKTEIGGVHLNVRTPDELDGAVEALGRVGAKRLLVEAMAETGVELVVGAHRDPIFGPVVVLGLGGTAAEALDDVSVRLAPVGRADAVTMLADLSGRRLLYGWRNGPTLNDEEIGEIVMVIGRLLADNPHLDTIEINPLRLTETGLVALDAAITTIGRSDDR
jgi:acetyltransferase